MEIKNKVYSIRYDGDILQYKCNRSFRPILKLFGYQDQFEMPLNILLHYRSKSYFLFITVKLCINQYHSDQKDLRPKVLNRILLLNFHTRQNERFITAMNQMIRLNMSGQVNLALAHIEAEKIQRFYSRLHMNSHKTEKSISKSKKITQNTLQTRPVSQVG